MYYSGIYVVNLYNADCIRLFRKAALSIFLEILTKGRINTAHQIRFDELRELSWRKSDGAQHKPFLILSL